MGNSETTWVVALIAPILPALFSVNQRLPAGPEVISLGAAPAVVVGKSTMDVSRQRNLTPGLVASASAARARLSSPVQPATQPSHPGIMLFCH